jgi:peptidoglycan/xylan/chitin deacetylase (PgdA/CDA1 family)
VDETERLVRMGLKQCFKNIAKDLLCYTGMPGFLLRFYRAGKKPVLLIFRYHRISVSVEKKEYMGMPLDVFEQQMAFIKSNFKVVPMAEGLRIMSEGGSSGIYASINFDDGYMDNYTHAFPILKKYSMPATVFLTTNFIGKSHAFWWDEVFNAVSSRHIGGEKMADAANRELTGKKEEEIEYFIEELRGKTSGARTPELSQMLGWDEIREMNKHNISFGGHTKTHRNLCLLDDDEINDELIGSKNIIEKNIGQNIKEFSYPFGKFDKRVRSLVIEAGYECARTSIKGINDKNTDKYALVSVDTGAMAKLSHLKIRIASIFLKGNRGR